MAHHLSGKVVREGRGRAEKMESKDLPSAIKHLENRLRQHLNTGVAIHHGDKKGHIAIEYYGSEDLHGLLVKLGLPSD